MPYDVTIKTTNGNIQKQINELKEMEALLIKYYDIYVSMSANEIKNNQNIIKQKSK